MNKIFSIIFLVLLYLSIWPVKSQKNTFYVAHQGHFSNMFHDENDRPIDVILKDTFQTGFLIKTYYMKFKVIYGFRDPEDITVRTSKHFFFANDPNREMSVFRRSERKDSPDGFVPLPPGALFIGDPAYGYWETEESGESRWRFLRGHKKFPEYLNWGDFRPTRNFSQILETHKNEGKAFYGINNEFGTEGMASGEKKNLSQKITQNFLKKRLEKFLFIPRIVRGNE